MTSLLPATSACLLLSTLAAAEPLPPLTTELVTTVPSGLVTSITQSPLENDRRLFIGLLVGAVYILPPDGSLSPSPFLDVTEITSRAGELGLFGMKFHPQFGETNWYFFINHSLSTGGTALARYEMSEDDRTVVDVNSRRVVYLGNSTVIHNAGDIHFGPDGYLYIATGDYSSGCSAQNPALRHGKIMRIDVDQSIDTPPYHGIPADNPFVGNPGWLDEAYFMGLRNPWRFSFDRATGDMWIADVGQTSREEVNHVVFPFDGGLNFGWPMWEGDVKTVSSCGANPPDGFKELTPPVHAYPRAVGTTIIGGFVYRGSKIPQLQGRYVFGDMGSGRIWAIDPADYSVEEVLSLRLSSSFTTFGEDRDGELYIGKSPQVLRIIPVPPAEIMDHLRME